MKEGSNSAFPWTEHNGDGSTYRDHEGMTLRDWFAAHAPINLQDAILAGGWSGPEVCNDDTVRTILFSTLTMMRYEYADAMLAARQGK